MKDIEQFFCETIYKFMKSHEAEIINEHLFNSGFKSKAEFFERIKTDFQDAAWCLWELLNWGMRDRDMDKQFIYTIDTIHSDGDYEEEVYMMMDDKTPRYFKIYLDLDSKTNVYNYRIVEVEKVTKMIKIETWEAKAEIQKLSKKYGKLKSEQNKTKSGFKKEQAIKREKITQEPQKLLNTT